MDTVVIKKVFPADITQLLDISRQTFFETFSPHNTEENMKKYLDEGFTHSKLAFELNDNNSDFYFAILDKKIIGYLKLNSSQSQTELKDDRAIEIERIYVLKDYHGKNIGKILYDQAVKAANQKNADYIWLGVWEKNERAISFYKKNGFIEFDKHLFKLGDDVQTDIMMKVNL